MSKFKDTKELMSQAKFFEGYSRWVEGKERYETWEESVERVMGMHEIFYADKIKNSEELNTLINEATESYKNKEVVGAQRALQFGGKQLLKNNMKLYNCSGSYADRPEFFGEMFWILLSGSGAGFSVQLQHIKKLPKIAIRNKQSKIHEVEDSIEGWAEALDVLMSSYFVGGGKHPDFEGRRVYFDLSLIRPKGAEISGGFKAPGPEPLRKALDKIEYLLQGLVLKGSNKLKSIDVYDIIMHTSDSVLSGGVRRCLPSGSKVHMRKGMQNIEDVKVGEDILTSTGYRKVTEKFDQGEQKLIEIFTQDGSIKCTPNHKIAIFTDTKNYEWKMAKDLVENDRMISPSMEIEGVETNLPPFKYIKPKHSTTCRDIKIPELDDDMAWFIGLMYGDGCVQLTSKAGQVSVSCHNDMPEIIEKATSQMARFGVNVKFIVYENYTVVTTKSKQLATYLQSWLKKPNTPIKLADFVWKSKTSIKMNIIAGLMDADGSIKTRPVNIANSVYPKFLKEIQLLASSCGMQTRIKLRRPSRNGKTRDWQTLYALNLINKHSIDIMNDYGFKKATPKSKESYSNTFPRKMLDFSYPVDAPWTNVGGDLIPVKVLRIENVTDKYQTWDLEVEEKHEFFCGGYLVHNSATICLFSKQDNDMLTAKTGNWFIDNPQRARSNNSVVLHRDEVTWEEFQDIMKSVKEFGEPGFYFVWDYGHSTNPCVEIGFLPVLKEEGKKDISGWQLCNLVEINGSKCTTEEAFYKACRVGAILGTLQAGYTNFNFVGDSTKKIVEREALLGVSITGWMNSPKILFDEKILKKGAEIVKQTNEKVAKLIDINPSPRCTAVKPSGNVSVILKTSSGIHGEHSPRYLRYVQMNKDSEVAQLIKKTNPHMVEESVWSTNKVDYTIAFPVVAQKGSIFKKNLKGIKLLEKVKMVQNVWIENGTNEKYAVDKRVRHSVSNTVQVPDDGWEEVTKYLFDNKESFAGVSFLADTGDRDYAQAPNTEVKSEKEIIKEYGEAALFASGLIVDANKGFQSLWEACQYSQTGDDYTDKETSDTRKDWVRRFKKFADNYLGGDMKKTEYCLKDVYVLYRWTKIQNNLVDIDFVNELQEKKFTDINTMGAIACSGGACEI